jgi:hypothetical protein
LTTLREIVRSIGNLPDDGVIVAVPPFEGMSSALVLDEPEEGDPVIPEGYEYVLGTYMAKEVLEVWSVWRNGRSPNLSEAEEAVIFYAVNDAYIPRDVSP